MKRFYERYYQADTKLRQAVAVLPWGHNLLLINKVKEDSKIEFYANETLAFYHTLHHKQYGFLNPTK